MRKINIARLIGALALSFSMLVPVHPTVGFVNTYSQEPLVLATSFGQTQTNSSFVNDLSQGLVVYMPFDDSTFSNQSYNQEIASQSIPLCKALVWESLPNRPVPGYPINASEVNGKIYVVGDAVQVLDLKTQTWSQKKSPPIPIEHAASVQSNEKIYLAGGAYRGWPNLTGDVNVYDTTTNSWITDTAMPFATWANQVVKGPDNKLYEFGGEISPGILPISRVLEYDLGAINSSTRTWIMKKPMPTARGALSAVYDGAGKIYVFGGNNDWSFTQIFSQNDVYDISSNSWYSRTSLPFARGAMSHAWVNGRIIAIGGSTNGSNRLKDVIQYNPISDEWTPLTPLPEGITWSGAVYASDGYLYVFDRAYSWPEHSYRAKIDCVEPTPPATIIVDDSLRLSSISPKVGDSVQASFKIKNTSDISITFNAITAGSRKGTGWFGEVFDWPVLPGKTLEPGEVFTYTATRLFNSSGDYFAEPVIQMNSSWGGIASANRVQFKVEDLGAGSIQVTYNAPLVPSQPVTNQQVMARFQVANVGNTSVDIQWLRMGGRLGADWNGELADWPAKTNIHLNPGQSYIYQAERTFNKAGDYFAEPVMSLASGCCGIAGATRQYFTVTLPVSQISSDTTPPSGDIDLSMSTPDLTKPIYGQKTVVFVPSILDDMSGIHAITPTIFYSGTWHDQNPFIEQRQGVHFTFPYKTYWSIPDGSPSQVITFAYIASDWAGNVSGYLGQRGVQYIAPDTDRFAPSGELQSASLENEIVTLTAAASDGITGSGISKVEFYALYDGIDHLIGESRFPPYTLQWDMPQIEHPQLISFTISVIDNVGNRQDIKDNGKTTLSFWTTSTNIEQRWVTNRQYLNQRALNTVGGFQNGNSACGVTSGSMVLAMLGAISKEEMPQTARDNFNQYDNNPSEKQNGIGAFINDIFTVKGLEQYRATDIQPPTELQAWSLIQSSINNNLPIIFNSTGDGPMTSAGHYIVVVGYRVVTDTSNIHKEIIVYDPFGEWKSKNYGSRYNDPSHLYEGKGKWVFYNFTALFRPGTDHLIQINRANQNYLEYSNTSSSSKKAPQNIATDQPDIISSQVDFLSYYEGAGQILGTEPQTITFSSVSNQLLSQQLVTLDANSTSGLTVTFNSLTPFVCDVTGSTVSFLKYGICAIQASQFGDATFATAEAATQSFPILHGYFLPNTIRQTASGW